MRVQRRNPRDAGSGARLTDIPQSVKLVVDLVGGHVSAGRPFLVVAFAPLVVRLAGDAKLGAQTRHADAGQPTAVTANWRLSIVTVFQWNLI